MMQPSVSYFDAPQRAGVIRLGAGRIGGQPGGGVIGRHDVGIAGKQRARIGYDVLFESGFEWRKTGKLPGVYAGGITDFAPGRAPNGLNGATIRPLWGVDGAASLYVWDMRVPAGSYGRVIHSSMRWPVGRFASVVLEVAMNTPGAADGWAELSIDGQLAARVSDFQASANDMALTGCFWCCFYGGGDSSYAPMSDQSVVISDVVGAPLSS